MWLKKLYSEWHERYLFLGSQSNFPAKGWQGNQQDGIGGHQTVNPNEAFDHDRFSLCEDNLLIPEPSD